LSLFSFFNLAATAFLDAQSLVQRGAPGKAAELRIALRMLAISINRTKISKSTT
jgi:hypothetical protein